MARRETLITLDKLKDNIFRDAFGEKPHKFYAIFDELMDEFIVKLVKPDQLAVEFPIEDTFSFLVDPTTFEVVGCELSNFTKVHLPRLPKLQKAWTSKSLEKCFSNYRELEYKPEEKQKKKEIEKVKVTNYYFVPIKNIDTVLATC